MSDEAPYLRIAAELRRRVDAGEIARGEPLPPLRQIARDFGVALATATKAVARLGQEGVVTAVPRVGTIVGGRPPRRAPARDVDLTRDRIVEAAVAIADAEGLDALSVRGVAARLGAPPMSLYRHVRDKAELVERMTDLALAAHPLPATRPCGFRAQLEVGARLEWEACRAHPWLARVLVITRPMPLPRTLAFADWMLGALDGMGLGPAARMETHIALHAFVQGLAVNLEAEAQAEGESGVSGDDWIRGREQAFEAAATSGTLPAFGKVLGELSSGFDLDLDAIFELGLRAMLDGIEARAARQPSTSRPAR